MILSYRKGLVVHFDIMNTLLADKSTRERVYTSLRWYRLSKLKARGISIGFWKKLVGNQTHLIGPIAQSLILADLVQMVYCVVLEKKEDRRCVCTCTSRHIFPKGGVGGKGGILWLIIFARAPLFRSRGVPLSPSGSPLLLDFFVLCLHT